MLWKLKNWIFDKPLERSVESICCISKLKSDHFLCFIANKIATLMLYCVTDKLSSSLVTRCEVENIWRGIIYQILSAKMSFTWPFQKSLQNPNHIFVWLHKTFLDFIQEITGKIIKFTQLCKRVYIMLAGNVSNIQFTKPAFNPFFHIEYWAAHVCGI